MDRWLSHAVLRVALLSLKITAEDKDDSMLASWCPPQDVLLCSRTLLDDPVEEAERSIGINCTTAHHLNSRPAYPRRHIIGDDLIHQVPDRVGVPSGAARLAPQRKSRINLKPSSPHTVTSSRALRSTVAARAPRQRAAHSTSSHPSQRLPLHPRYCESVTTP